MPQSSNRNSVALSIEDLSLRHDPRTVYCLGRVALAANGRLIANGISVVIPVDRISAATCGSNAGELSQATNLFQAALAGPLNDSSRATVAV